MVFALFLLALFLFILWLCLFTFLYFFLVLTHLSLHFVIVLFCFRSQKPELNPKPRTLHPISDGPFRWTLPPVDPPSAGQPSAGQPSADNPPPDRPKFRSFFSLLPPQFSFFFLSLGVLSLNFGGVLKTATLKSAHLGSRAVV